MQSVGNTDNGGDDILDGPNSGLGRKLPTNYLQDRSGNWTTGLPRRPT